MGLMVLTGRRPAEIFFSAKLTLTFPVGRAPSGSSNSEHLWLPEPALRVRSFIKCNAQVVRKAILVKLGDLDDFRTRKVAAWTASSYPRREWGSCSLRGAICDQLRTIAHSLESGSLRVELDRVFPLAEARAAHRHLEEEHVHGKTVLLLD
jgi:hypothetical protein